MEPSVKEEIRRTIESLYNYITEGGEDTEDTKKALEDIVYRHETGSVFKESIQKYCTQGYTEEEVTAVFEEMIRAVIGMTTLVD